MTKEAETDGAAAETAWDPAVPLGGAIPDVGFCTVSGGLRVNPNGLAAVPGGTCFDPDGLANAPDRAEAPGTCMTADGFAAAPGGAEVPCTPPARITAAPNGASCLWLVCSPLRDAGGGMVPIPNM